MSRRISFLSLILLFSVFLIPLEASSVLFEIEAIDMENVAGNRQEAELSDTMWYRRASFVNKYGQGKVPASTTVSIPTDGEYFVWAYYRIHPIRRKSFAIIIDGKELVFGRKAYGKTPEEKPDVYQGREATEKGMIWTRERVTLKAGAQVLELNANPNPPGGKWSVAGATPQVQAILLTNDPNYQPDNR